jgi:hypothetical protein
MSSFFTRTQHIFICSAIVVFSFMSFSGGVDSNYAGHPNDNGQCLSCHTSVGTGSVVLTGAPTTYEAGTIYPLTLTLTRAGAVVGGFQILASTGASSNDQVGEFSAPAGTRIVGTERLTHDAPKSFTSGSVSWDFLWTSPSSGAPSTVKFYFSANAANGNGGSGPGDYGYKGESASIPLPVDIVTFDADQDGKNIILTWKTASEKEIEAYHVMRSTDNITFTQLDEISSESNTQAANSYSFTDKTLDLERDVYYRLDVKHQSGDITSSRSVHVNLQRKDIKVQLLQSNIGLNENELRFMVSTTSEELFTARMIGLDGRIYGQGKVVAGNESSIALTGSSSPMMFLQILDEQSNIVFVQKYVHF